MSERENQPFKFTSSEVYETAREMMGPYRLESLSAFSTKEHLQRKYNSFRDNPNLLAVRRSEIIGGDNLLKEHREDLERRHHTYDAYDKISRLDALHRFFNIGFALVERTIVSHRLGYGSETVTPRAHKEWVETPQAERVAEMHAYLGAQDADLLAYNLLEGEQEGSMMQLVCDFTVSVSQVTGEEPYRMDASQDPGAKEQVTEGVLAAMYLLREHQVAQEMHDMDKLLGPPEQKTVTDTAPPEKTKGTTPPEAPPGYY